MLERLLKMYEAFMAYNVRTPLPHLVGPPGCGKSSDVEKLGQLVGKKVRTLNVSRISPLELEGVQVPQGGKLEHLLAAIWDGLQDGDIILLDEFLRGFPEVYNGLLDILTSRRVLDHELPKVFFVAASNSVTTYDPALEDRILHLPVRDLRVDSPARDAVADTIIDALGLVPSMKDTVEMERLFKDEILPTYEVLDYFKGKGAKVGTGNFKGRSSRKLIGMAMLREVEESQALKGLLAGNNARAIGGGAEQFVFLTEGTNPPTGYYQRAKVLLEDPTLLTATQIRNIKFNLQLIELEMEKNRHLDGIEDPTLKDAIENDSYFQ